VRGSATDAALARTCPSFITRPPIAAPDQAAPLTSPDMYPQELGSGNTVRRRRAVTEKVSGDEFVGFASLGGEPAARPPASRSLARSLRRGPSASVIRCCRRWGWLTPAWAEVREVLDELSRELA
jgi:hypothetical protein